MSCIAFKRKTANGHSILLFYFAQRDRLSIFIRCENNNSIINNCLIKTVIPDLIALRYAHSRDNLFLIKKNDFIGLYRVCSCPFWNHKLHFMQIVSNLLIREHWQIASAAFCYIFCLFYSEKTFFPCKNGPKTKTSKKKKKKKEKKTDYLVVQVLANMNFQ